MGPSRVHKALNRRAESRRSAPAGVRSGKPCFVGTRIAVYDVLEYLAGGMSNDDIVADFPELNESHIRAALEFAAARERRLALPA